MIDSFMWCYRLLSFLSPLRPSWFLSGMKWQEGRPQMINSTIASSALPTLLFCVADLNLSRDVSYLSCDSPHPPGNIAIFKIFGLCLSELCLLIWRKSLCLRSNSPNISVFAKCALFVVRGYGNFHVLVKMKFFVFFLLFLLALRCLKWSKNIFNEKSPLFSKVDSIQIISLLFLQRTWLMLLIPHQHNFFFHLQICLGVPNSQVWIEGWPPLAASTDCKPSVWLPFTYLPFSFFAHETNLSNTVQSVKSRPDNFANLISLEVFAFKLPLYWSGK